MRSLHPREPRGWYGVALWQPKYPGNAGAIFRSAVICEAKLLIVVGERYTRQRGDTLHAEDKLPIIHAADEEAFWQVVPAGCTVVAAELTDGAFPLPHYDHPVRALYVFGPEDGSVPPTVLARSQCIQIPGRSGFNVAAAASIVLYDRMAKRARLVRHLDVLKNEPLTEMPA